MSLLLAFLSAALIASAAGARARGATATERSGALLQAWSRELAGSNSLHTAHAQDTPVTRVVSLLKKMHVTLQSEMKEDEELYDKLACWCNNNNYEKSEAVSTSEAKIAELTETIKGLTAKSANLETSIKELNNEVAANKASLAEATALREKQQKEFHGSELDSIQAIENLKAALAVLAKHHEAAPESSVAGGPIFKTERDSWESLLSVSVEKAPWTSEHVLEHMTHELDDFMSRNGFETLPESDASLVAEKQTAQKLLRAGPAAEGRWPPEDAALLRRALKSAAGFMQAHHRGGYYPAYNARSGEIVGVLKQLKEEMESDLSESQKREADRVATFAELRSAKVAEIESGEKMAEQKEDEYATTKNLLAEAKEDLGQEEASLSADQKFLINLKKTCAEASKNFEERKTARLQEIQAVSETIEILQKDEARDAMSGTFSFLQGKSAAQHKAQHRGRAAEVLRKAATTLKDPQLSVLATAVELDAFTKVKKAIDDMIAMLKVQQADEVKKVDYCKAQLQENEMTSARTEDHKADLVAKRTTLESEIQTLTEGIAMAKAHVSQMQLDLQRASEDRKMENIEFQKTVADQTVTVEVLKEALDRLATYYDKEAFLQKTSQTPPVPQMEYVPSKGAPGVMQLIEKLIQDARALSAESVKSESEAQRAYEQTVADTNAGVAALQQEITTKSKAKAVAEKERMQTESDIKDTDAELEGLAKYNSELHAECDYVLKNFAARQEARAQEIEALQQAKQILSGASLS